MKRKPLTFIVMTLLLGIYVFFEAPNLSPLYSEGAFFWLVVVTAYLLVATVVSFKMPTITDNNGHSSIHFDKSKLPKKWVLVVLGVLWAVFFLIQIIFTPLFFWKSYRDQLSEPIVKEFTSEVQAVDMDQVPIVDSDLASTLADKKLGEKPSLGSQVRLGEPTIQTVDGKLVWIVPLQHSGFFKWLANMSGSAGYIKISATSLQDVEYVDNYKIKIQPDSYFLHDLSRKVRFTRGWFTGITDYSFELDDSGKPYWVVTTYQNTCGFNLPEANGAIIVDAETGKTQRYSLKNVPSWVDRIQPEDFLFNQLNNNGKYIHGIFNFSNHEKYRSSEGDNIIYNNGNCYFFTGITSVGVDESATGFVMIDMVTKDPLLYRMSGATETVAKSSAAGKVQDMGYYATFPIILNVYDQPTYFMTLKDNAKLIKKYAFVNVKDYMIVGVGDTIADAEKDYHKSMNDIANRPDFETGDTKAMKEKTINGTVDRISYSVNSNVTVYSFTLLEKPGIIFTADVSLSSKLPLTMKGDSVSVTYNEQEEIVSAVKFDNLSLFQSIGSMSASSNSNVQ